MGETANKVNAFEKLRSWQLSIDFAVDIYELNRLKGIATSLQKMINVSKKALS